MRKSPFYTHFLPIKWTASIQIRFQKYFSPIESKRSQSSSVSIWSAGHQFQSDRQQFSLQVKLTKYKWKVTGDTKAPTEMDASCGKIIATTKKVIRVTAYMHIRVGKLDVPMSSFRNLVRAKLETQKHLPKWMQVVGEEDFFQFNFQFPEFVHFFFFFFFFYFSRKYMVD